MSETSGKPTAKESRSEDETKDPLLKKYESVLHCSENYNNLKMGFRPPVFRAKKFRLGDMMRNTDEDLVALKALATEEQKQDPLFNAFASRYPREQFARYVIDEARLTKEDIKKLIELNTVFKHRLRQFDWIPKAVTGVILTVALLLLREVPREIFDRYGWNYAAFKLGVLITTASTVFIFTAVILAWYIHSKALRQEYNDLEFLLSLCLIFADA
jgi:hypothetical protein